MENQNGVEETAGKKKLDSWVRKAIIIFLVWCLVTLPCACLLGYRTQWILWKLGF
jgi:hypothetical protein